MKLRIRILAFFIAVLALGALPQEVFAQGRSGRVNGQQAGRVQQTVRNDRQDTRQPEQYERDNHYGGNRDGIYARGMRSRLRNERQEPRQQPSRNAGGQDRNGRNRAGR